MRFQGENHNRVLLRSNETIHVHNGAIIQYHSMYKCNVVPCIGVVQCPKLIDNNVVGIYVMPVKMYIDQQWYNVLAPPSIPRNYTSYPELLVAIMDLSTITNTIPHIDCVDTIQLM